ncbi:LysR family transcriptional regulator [Thiomicrospira aerophila AL3]|uniref:LysR family transcriptional regulator n=1 Tax=Thiomicrospira aerophila AL3 TaxID=717772 RepID=W0DQG0_9GAMM|nr:LysR family transcriptional regulator [Thiomicrospira aerophila]AHF00850.1 LysR family transcriptional regulator [Thiomicrospira aerophila AL3]
MRITLRQLQTFETLARRQSFSLTAQEMHVSQPTVSKQIKALQEEIGLPLLEQFGKKIFLTEAGETLYQTCNQWLKSWDQFEQTIANMKGMTAGRLRIATVTTTKYFLPKLIGQFCQHYPGVDIRLEILNRERVMERLERNEDDVYIMGVPPDNPRIEAMPFLANSLLMIAALNHPLTKQKNIPFTRVAQEPFVFREPGSGTRLQIEKLFAERHQTPVIRLEMGSNEAIKQAVAGGLGLSILSSSTLIHEQKDNELAVLDVEGFPIKRSWYWVQHKNKNLPIIAQTFYQFLLANIDQFKV